MDIGKEVKEVEFEPVQTPVREPNVPDVPVPPAPASPEPVKEPAYG